MIEINRNLKIDVDVEIGSGMGAETGCSLWGDGCSGIVRGDLDSAWGFRVRLACLESSFFRFFLN